MIIEILITAAIIIWAVFIFYKNIKKSTAGECNCGSCSSHCPSYKNEKK